MTYRTPSVNLWLLPLAAAAFGVSGVFNASGADLSDRLPKAATREISFAAEVKPILERSCAQCHSGEKPKGKFSVEGRDTLLKGGDSKEAALIVGQSGSSLLVHLVADLVHEMEMPPVAKREKFPALNSEEIGIVRAWIDQGAKWPENEKLSIAQSTEAKDQVVAKAAVKNHPIFDAIRSGDRRSIAKALKDSAAVNLRDDEGNTPLIQAAFYLPASQLAQFIDRGADVNATNSAGVSALMKAVWDLDKTRLLIQRGANVNAASKMGNTPLITAAFANGASEVVKALIKAGANVNAANGASGNAVTAAAEAGDLKTLRMVLDHGGDPDSTTHIVESGAGASALMIASQMGHIDCVKLLLERGAKLNLRTEHGNALNFAAFSDRHEVARLLLDRGIEIDVPGQRVVSFRRGDKGFTPLIYACLSERNDPTLVKWLIDRGADVNAKSSSGETPLSVALQRGNTKIVSTLLAAGAKADEPKAAEKKIARWNHGQAAHPDLSVLRESAKEGVTAVVMSGARMSEATGHRCASCHQQSIPAMAWGYAREKGFTYPEPIAKEQLASTLNASGFFAGMAVEMPLPVPNIASWSLIGLDAAGHQPDGLTDKLAYTLARYQYADGRWVTKASRAPTDYSDVSSTAAAIRALKLYAPPTMKNRIERNLAKATTWLRSYQAQSTEERAMQILGLRWAGVSTTEINKFAQALIAEQRADGGWAQLPTLDSDAYATGLTLYALKQAGVIPVSHAAYQSGVKFLLENQLQDGTWRVKTRVSPVQVAIDDIFPHGHDQWISTVATSWASIALMQAAEQGQASPKLTASK
jgi:ankyrin repeat protein